MSHSTTALQRINHYLTVARWLHSEVTLGFELEGIVQKGVRLDVEFAPWFGVGLDIKDDSSIERIKEGEQSFEFASPVLPCNVTTISKMLKFLAALPSMHIRTNTYCGFHVHFGFPNFTNLDRTWIMLQLGANPEMQQKLIEFKRYRFIHAEFATLDLMTSIGNYLSDDNLSGACKAISTVKYTLLRVHPQGTLEWRGPRNFLNKPNIKEIKEFLLLMWDFISWLTKAQSNRSFEYAGFTYTKQQVTPLVKELVKVDPAGRTPDQLMSKLKVLLDKNKSFILNRIYELYADKIAAPSNRTVLKENFSKAIADTIFDELDLPSVFFDKVPGAHLMVYNAIRSPLNQYVESTEAINLAAKSMGLEIDHPQANLLTVKIAGAILRLKGSAVLSPQSFGYDSDEFVVRIALGSIGRHRSTDTNVDPISAFIYKYYDLILPWAIKQSDIQDAVNKVRH